MPLVEVEALIESVRERSGAQTAKVVADAARALARASAQAGSEDVPLAEAARLLDVVRNTARRLYEQDLLEGWSDPLNGFVYINKRSLEALMKTRQQARTIGKNTPAPRRLPPMQYSDVPAAGYAEIVELRQHMPLRGRRPLTILHRGGRLGPPTAI